VSFATHACLSKGFAGAAVVEVVLDAPGVGLGLVKKEVMLS